MPEQFKVAVPMHQRVRGWLYDFDSGICLGIASDELKETRKGQQGEFRIVIAGCPHKAVIHV